MAHAEMKTLIGERVITVQIVEEQPTVWLEVETEGKSSTTIVGLTGFEAMELGKKLTAFGIHSHMNTERALAAH